MTLEKINLDFYYKKANFHSLEANRKENLRNECVSVRPPCSLFHKIGIFVMSSLSAFIFSRAVPESSDDDWKNHKWFCIVCDFTGKLLYAFGSLIGAYLTVSIGNLKFKKKYPMIGCITSTILCQIKGPAVLVPVITSALTLWKGLKWHDRKYESRNRRKITTNCLNFITYCLWLFLYLLLVFTGVWNNVKIQVGEEEETVTVQEALSNFFKSDAWHNLKDSLGQLYITFQREGWRRMLDEAWAKFDIPGEENAYKVLGISPNASQEEIKTLCHKLDLELHPDKQKNKDEADSLERYIQVRKACRKLKDRSSKSKKTSQYSSSTSEENGSASGDVCAHNCNMASVTVAYFLCIFFGWLGWHHLYLGRVNQAVVWCVTLGGGLGIGWIRDLWKISSYVREANREVILRNESYSTGTPLCSTFHKLGIFVMSGYSARLFSWLVPEISDEDWQSYPWYSNGCDVARNLLLSCGSLMGAYLTANIGNVTFEKKYPMIGCMAASILFPQKNLWILVPFMTSTMTLWKGLKWHDRRNEARNRRTITQHCLNIIQYYMFLIIYLPLIWIGSNGKAHKPLTTLLNPSEVPGVPNAY
ncbi:hypothetical protein Btru_043195 [Bulinus truncatus]|nr:hypothetical protein Btru_043195 [Bulinus truncatus]